LAVYSGSSISTLTPVVSKGAGATNPSLTFLALAGVTYKIALDGGAGVHGDTELYFRAVPTNDPFESPQAIAGSAGSLTGSNVNASWQEGEPDHGGPGGRSVWYLWSAPSEGAVRFETTGSSFDTVLGVYTGNMLAGLSPVVSNDDCDDAEPGASASCVTFDAVAGTSYRLAVDGYNFESGGLALSWRPAVSCTIVGTSGADALTGTAGDDVLCGRGGDDILKGQGGNDTIIGGAGVDTVSFADAAAGVVANLTTGTATGQGSDVLEELEAITGSPHVDKLDGDAANNALSGGAGADGLWGQGGDDTVQGGGGADTIGPGPGDDTASGGLGTDTAHFARAGAVIADLRAGTASGQGTDVLTAMENVVGSPAADQIYGTGVANVLQGAGGSDTVEGRGGDDTLYGAAGDDVLHGGNGADSCDGGIGTDTATSCATSVSIP
jgi:Ca2+-binding RTX toxin-like protein